MRNLYAVVCLFSLSFIFSCSSTKQLKLNEVVGAKGVIEFTAMELNDKIGKKKFDVLIAARNLSQDPLLFFLAEIQCFKGKTQGNFEYAFFGVGERSIDLKIGQRKQWRFLCVLPQEVKGGEYTINFTRIYTNPNNDGRTTGKVLAKDMKIEINGGGHGGGKKAKKK